MSALSQRAQVVRVEWRGHPGQISMVVPSSRVVMDLLRRAAAKLHFDPDTVFDLWIHSDSSPNPSALLEQHQPIPCGDHLLLEVHASQAADAPSCSFIDEQPSAPEEPRPPRATRTREARGQCRVSVEELRARSQRLMKECHRRGVVVTELGAETAAAEGKFGRERHGHGTGNTKNTKKRRLRDHKEALRRLVEHLEVLLSCPIETQQRQGDD
eukprot:TRINITY_DN25100_c0_g1_i2.p1 TRINITY_DN25100_c0_g1~~TRINITY_DN25100_c0_g1_i2.p1  ORF type:complete len:213 (+),score=34.59 TRINITY_DN25100_c0_g1_i2:179-817(+)